MGLYCDEKPELVQKWDKGIGKTICELSQNQCLSEITVKYVNCNLPFRKEVHGYWI